MASVEVFLFMDTRVESERYWWDKSKWFDDRRLPGDPPHMGEIRTVKREERKDIPNDWHIVGDWKYGFDFGSVDKPAKTTMTFVRQREWCRVFAVDAGDVERAPTVHVNRTHSVVVHNRADLHVSVWRYVRARSDFHPNLWFLDADWTRRVHMGTDLELQCSPDRDLACVVVTPGWLRPPSVSCSPASEAEGASLTEALHRSVPGMGPRANVYVVTSPKDGDALRCVGKTQYSVQFSGVGDRIREWVAESVDRVRSDSSEDDEEGDRSERAYVTRRFNDVCRPALEAFVGNSSVADTRIAVCFSGGGLRAMISAIGFSEGLADIGFSDCILYRGGVSGGAWALNMLTVSGIHVDEKSVGDRLQKAAQSLPWGALASSDVVRRLRQLEAFKPRHALTIADAYGAAVTAHWAPELLDTRISEQLTTSIPFPIYNCVRDRGSHAPLEWCEFTPTDVRFVESQRVVPTRLFGRRFRNGQCVSRAPEAACCFFNGLFGSAFCANPAEMEATVGGAGAKVLQTIGLKNKRFLSPPTFHNPFFESGEEEKKKKAANEPYELRLLDAGVKCNASLPSFVDAPHRRGVDVVICFDARPTDPDPSVSKDVLSAFCDFTTAEAYPYESVSVQLPISVFPHKRGGPTLVYAGLAKHDDFVVDCSFDPATSCSFMKFSLAEEDISRLRGLARHTAHKLKPTLKQLLLDRK